MDSLAKLLLYAYFVLDLYTKIFINIIIYVKQNKQSHAVWNILELDQIECFQGLFEMDMDQECFNKTVMDIGKDLDIFWNKITF